jgi:phosphoserine phosphatase
VTECNITSHPGHHAERQRGHTPKNRDCSTYGEEKAVQVRRLAAERGYSLPGCYAYSDSVTDLPLLEIVGHPRAVNPDRALRRIAAVRGWPVLSFSGV